MIKTKRKVSIQGAWPGAQARSSGGRSVVQYWGGVSWGGHGDWIKIKEKFPEEAKLGGQEANSGGQELGRPFRRPILGGGGVCWGGHGDWIKIK